MLLKTICLSKHPVWLIACVMALGVPSPHVPHLSTLHMCGQPCNRHLAPRTKVMPLHILCTSCQAVRSPCYGWCIDLITLTTDFLPPGSGGHTELFSHCVPLKGSRACCLGSLMMPSIRLPVFQDCAPAQVCHI